MESSNKKKLLALLIAVTVICFLAITIIPIIANIADKKTADNALSLVLADQKDGSLTTGTVIKVGDKSFSYDENELAIAKDPLDTSASVATAVIGEETVVYLLAADGAPTAYTPSADIKYVTLIDPDDASIETYTYSQVNQAAQKYLDEVSYEDAEESVSEIAKYVDPSTRYDRPVGYTIELEEGELTVFDNGSQSAYTVTVPKGPYTFYNITPGMGGEFYVRNGEEIVQRGHLRPTGTLRMIYTDTHELENMRDLGGWPCDGGTIKYNLLIRGGQVVDATDTDRNTWVKLLGIDHDLFLKTYSDDQLKGREVYKTQSPLGDTITLYQNDLSAEGSENKRNYSQAKEQMNGIINYLFDNAIAGETTYFHCLAGADRTGMVAIIVEGVLGVSKGDIDRDYELTSFKSLRERNNTMYISDIDILNSYAGDSFRDKCINYLLDCGITLEKINDFRKAVIDGNPEPLIEVEPDPGSTNFCMLNDIGWIDGGRCSSTGEDRYDAEGYTLTNYVSVKPGDIVFVKNLNLSDTLFSGIYASDKTAIAGFTMTDSGGAGFVKDIEQEGVWESFTVEHADAGFLRLCGTITALNKPVVININRDGNWL